MRVRVTVLLIALGLVGLCARQAPPTQLVSAGAVTPEHSRPLALPSLPVTPGRSSRASAPTPPDTHWPPTRSLLFNDPDHHRHAIADTLVRYIEATPRGATIRVSTYFIGSGRIGDALAAAAHRGVHVRVVVSAKTRPQYAAGRRLARTLAHVRGSWMRWAPHATRGYTGIDHQKIYRFSRVGSRPDVTVLGSYNSAWRSDDEAYSLMVEVTRPAIYDALAGIFAQSVRGAVVLPNPLRSFAGRGWGLYVLPSFTPRQDPALDRLRSIPAGPSTQMRIAMYAMTGARAGRITHRLEAMARAGTRITFAVGPGVARWIGPALASSGVRVVAGCFADGTYTHSKDMSATWRRHGRRTWWTWVGSDNWTDFSNTSDEATLGLRGKALYDDFDRDFDALLARRQIPQRACHPDDRAGQVTPGAQDGRTAARGRAIADRRQTKVARSRSTAPRTPLT